MMNVLVSIIVPIYNTEKYIEKCLDSLVKQNFEDYEIICIDDASIDNSLRIVLRYQRLYDKIKVVELNTNKGQSNARNIGMSMAQGKYIYFIDSDDMLKDINSLKDLYDIAEEEDADCLMFNSEVFYENDVLRREYGNVEVFDYDIDAGVYKGKDFFLKMVNSELFSVAVWKQFWKKDYLMNSKIKFNSNISHAEDLLFSFESIYNAKFNST